jgi:CheY-like chemotaxis protein
MTAAACAPGPSLTYCVRPRAVLHSFPYGPPAGGIKILVVEDDDDNREVLAQSLISEGAIVTAVSTAADALPLVSSSDIVLTDYALPKNDGVWLLECVNKQAQPAPVIAISGYDQSQEPRLATAPSLGSYSSHSSTIGSAPKSRWPWAPGLSRHADDQPA